MKSKVLLLALCICVQAFSQRKPKIKGSRNVVEVRQELSDFDTVVLDDDLDVFLRKGASPGYTIAADDNLIDVLKFKVVDGTLTITSYYKVTSKKKLEITVEFPDLKELVVHDGKVVMDEMTALDDLYVLTDGAARVQLDVSASKIQLEMKGMSAGEYNLDTDDLASMLADRVDARIYSMGGSQVLTMADNASARLEGSADALTVTMAGRTSLKGEKYEVGTIRAKCQEHADAHFNMQTLLDLSAAGESKTYVQGPGKIELTDFVDTAQLSRVAE